MEDEGDVSPLQVDYLRFSRNGKIALPLHLLHYPVHLLAVLHHRSPVPAVKTSATLSENDAHHSWHLLLASTYRPTRTAPSITTGIVVLGLVLASRRLEKA